MPEWQVTIVEIFVIACNQVLNWYDAGISSQQRIWGRWSEDSISGKDDLEGNGESPINYAFSEANNKNIYPYVY